MSRMEGVMVRAQRVLTAVGVQVAARDAAGVAGLAQGACAAGQEAGVIVPPDQAPPRAQDKSVTRVQETYHSQLMAFAPMNDWAPERQPLPLTWHALMTNLRCCPHAQCSSGQTPAALGSNELIKPRHILGGISNKIGEGAHVCGDPACAGFPAAME